MGDTTYQRASRIGAAAGMVLFCGVCAWESARLGFTPVESNAEYHFRQWQTLEEGAAQKAQELAQALALNPRYSEAWIATGLEAEARGDRTGAEVSFRRAAAIDRTHIPKWTLANLYLRSGDMPQFWAWARQAVEIAPDPAAVFQLCWRASDDAAEILRKAIPPSREVRRGYLSFLVRTSRLEAAGPLADELSLTADGSSVDALLSYCDLALSRKQVGPAFTVWSALAERRLIPYVIGDGLTNGDLSAAPLGRGFDWRPARVEGAWLSVDTAAHEMSITLSGKQAGSYDSVEQFVPLQPGAQYVFRYRTRGLTGSSGLSWNWIDARTDVVFASAQTDEPATLSCPCELARLVLRYRRPLGSVRAEGVVVFDRFSLEKLESKERQKAKGKRQK